jgi:UDP-4-amino-4,6-dideoxy-N-acetyl-beta-L-altrosamine transaminase
MIPYGHQSINQKDINAVVDALRSDWLTTGPLVGEFEQAIEAVVGAPCAVVSSGTAALHCAYFAIGIEPGDEIITPPITFIATQATAALFGANIVFADVEPDTANIDPRAVEAAITPRTKAIVAVDYAGHPAEMAELRALADKHGLYLLEDAAHSIGSLYKGLPVGSLADITTFSFFPTKNLTTAEGGAVASTKPELLRRAREFSRQGLVRDPERFKIRDQGSWHQEVHEFGLNYRLPDVLCALGLSQLARLPEFKMARESIFSRYSRELQNCANIVLPVKRADVDPIWHLFSVRVDASRRKEIFQGMRARGIGVQVNYIPAYWHPVFEKMGYQRGLCPNAEAYYEGQLSLPMYSELTPTDQDFVIQTLNEFVD